MRAVSLQTKIVLYTVGIAATMAVLFSSINLLLDYRSSQSHIRRHLIDLANSIAETVQSDLYFNRHYELRKTTRNFSNYRNINEIAILDTQGLRIASGHTRGNISSMMEVDLPDGVDEIEGNRYWHEKNQVIVLTPVIAEKGETLGYVYIASDTRTEMLDLRHKLGYGLSLSGLVGILMSMLGYFAGKRFSGSLVALTKTVKDLAEGRATKTLPVSSKDELGQLTQTFNEMVEQRKTAEASLERSRQHLLFVLNETSLAYIVWDLNFRVLTWNKAAEKIFGFPASEAKGKHALELIVPEEIHGQVEEIWSNIIGDSGETGIINENLRADGSRIVCQWNNTVIRDPEGEITAVASLVDDITESITAQDKMRQAMEDAQQATKAKSDFLANMSHEIRTPMNGVIGLTDLLLESDLLPEQRNYVEIIRGSGEMLLTIINDILDLSKIESGKLDLTERVFDLEECLGSAIHLFSRNLDSKKLERSVELDPFLPRYVIGDPIRLRQIVYNLVGNAVKFTDHGSIVLKAHSEETRNDRLRIHVTVKDSGCGIDASRVESIFDPFNQGDSSPTRTHGGTGLGLTICKRLCKLMDGDIWIDSTSPRGTVFAFNVLLKMATQEQAQADPKNILERTTSRKNSLNIIVAEDNSVNRLVTKRILKRLGFDCTTVEDGSRAVQLAISEPCDLIFMDIQMPVMDGLTAARKIKDKLGSAIHIVALTASAIEADRERCFQAGMDDYLAKPIDIHAISEVVRKVDRQVKQKAES